MVTTWKAWVAFIGSVVTALLASDLITDATWIKWLAGLSAILTAVATYRVPYFVPVDRSQTGPGVVP